MEIKNTNGKLINRGMKESKSKSLTIGLLVVFFMFIVMNLVGYDFYLTASIWHLVIFSGIGIFAVGFWNTDTDYGYSNNVNKKNKTDHIETTTRKHDTSKHRAVISQPLKERVKETYKKEFGLYHNAKIEKVPYIHFEDGKKDLPEVKRALRTIFDNGGKIEFKYFNKHK